MKSVQLPTTQRHYNLLSLGCFVFMVAVTVVHAFFANLDNTQLPLLGATGAHGRFYSLLLALTVAAVLFVSYLRGNDIALKLSTLTTIVTMVLGLQDKAFEFAVPQAIWIPFILALTLTNVRWSLLVFALTVAAIVYRFPGAFQARFGIEVTVIILGVLTASRLVQDLLLENATTAEMTARRMADQLAQQNEQLKRSQGEVNAILGAIPDTLFEVDEAGRFLVVRSNTGYFLDTPTQDLIGRNVADVLQPPAAAAVRQALAEAGRQGTSYGTVVKLPLRGDDAWFELSVARHRSGGTAGDRFVAISRDVTRRHQAEEEAQRLSQVIEQSPESIIITDHDARIVYVNPAFTEISGYQPGDVIGRNPRLLGVGDTPSETKRAMWAALAKGEAWQGEFQNRRKHGGDYLERVIISPLRDSAGETTHYVALKRDITALRQQEQEIARDRERLRNVVSGTGAGPWEWDFVSNRLILDDASANMVGLSLAELGDDHLAAWSDRIHPDDRVAVERRLDDHLRGDSERFDGEYRVRHADGRWIWIQTRGRVINRRADNGPLTMYGVHLDVSTQRQAEERRRYLEGLLVSSIETIGEGFAVYDPEDRLTWCNEQYRRLYPRSAPHFVIGRTFEEIVRYGVAQGQYPEAIADPEPWIQGRLEAHRQQQSNLLQQLPDGRWLEVRERKAADGSTVGFRLDVTELMEAKHAAEAANRAKSEFLATMSHEVRTPLNSILGMAQMLCTSGLTEQRSREYGRVILDSGRALLTVLNDVLDWTKVEAGRVALDMAPFEPGQLVDDVLALFQGQAHGKGLSIVARWEGADGQRYLGDVHRLRQMVSNLLSNAIKFTASGSIDLSVREAGRNGTAAVLEFAVADTGIGIPSHKQEGLFQPFTQADSSTTRQFGGTGLGLSIVRNLAILMGGEAGLESDEGKGTRTWFRIAATVAPETPDGVGKRPRDHAHPSSPAFSGSVLVVDDNEIERKVIGTLLTRLGLRVSFANDGSEAVDTAFGNTRPDLIFMDCLMPGLDGYAACERIRRLEAEQGLPRVPIVATSASVFAEDRERCAASGMDHFLPKPFAMPELQEAVATTLQSRRTDPAGHGRSARADTTFDRQELRARIEALAPLLQQNKFDALPLFADLQQRAARTDIAPELDAIAESVKAFQFEPALLRLRSLLPTQ